MQFCKQTTGLAGLSRHVFSKLVHTTLSTTAVIGIALFGTGNVMAGQLGDCAAEYTSGQGGLNCTANDDGGEIEAVNPPTFCLIGSGLTFDVETTFLNSTNASRYDMRYWVGIDGGDPRETAANGGPALCSVSSLVIGAPIEVTDEENFPGQDTCGDVASGVTVPLTTIDTVTIECLPDAIGRVVFSSAITWDTTSKNDCSVDNLRDPTSISKSQAACIATELLTESLGRVTVVKSAPEDLTGQLDFTFDWNTDSPPQDPTNAAMNPPAQFTLSDTESMELYSVVTDVGTAVVTITEQDPTGLGFTLGSISCPNASVTPIQGGVEVTLSYDEANPSLADVTCTFNNVEIQTNPAMTVSKSSTTGAVTMPGLVTYNYLVTNTGDVELTGVSLVDNHVDGVVTCEATTIAVGSSINCTATYTVTQADIDQFGSPTPASGLLSNTVIASSIQTPDETTELDIPITQTAELELVKTATPQTYSAASEQIDYQFRFTNTGNVTLYQPFTVTDDIATDEACPVAPASLAPGEFIDCTATYTITQADVDAGSVTNIASGSGQDPDGGTVNSNTDTETVTVVGTGTLILDKIATPSTYDAVGQVISYSYDLTNGTNVTLYPAFTIDDDISTDENCPQPASLAPGETVTCTASHTITQADLDNGSVTNVATGTAQDPDDVTVTSNPDTETVTANVTGTLALDKTATPQSYSTVGDVISYNYDLTNNTNVTLYPAFTIDDDVSTDENCPQPASLAPGDTVTCTASYTITQADLDSGSVTNVATGTAQDPDDVTVTSNPDTETVNANVTGTLVLDKTASPATYDTVGDLISYSYELTNGTNVTLYPAFTIDDDISTDENCPQPASLAPGDSITCTASHTISQADIDNGSVTNVATGTAQDPDDVTVTSNPDTETVNAVQAGTLVLDKTATPQTYDTVGQVISYSYELTNGTNASLFPTFAIDDDVSTDENCPQPASLEPGNSITCTASYTITQADLDNGFVTNVATGSASDGEGTVTSNPDTETVNAVVTGSLALDKMATPATYSAVGQVISYTYDLTNGTNVTLYPAFAIDDDVSTDENCPQPASLAPGDSITCTASYTIAQADIDNGSVTNVATGSALDPDGGTVTSNPDTETVNADVTGSLVLVKTATPQTYSAVGEVISYSYVLTNNTNAELHAPYTIDDDVSTDENCPAVPTPLAPNGGSVTCTASHTITQADLDAGFVTNVAIGTAQDAPADGQPVQSNQDSETVNAVLINLSKSAAAPMYDVTSGRYTVVYTITAFNGGSTAGTYNLVDTLAPAVGITLVSAELAYAGGETQTGSTPGPLPYSFASGEQVVTGEGLVGGATESWTVRAVFDVDPTLVDGDARACVDGDEQAGQGFYNLVTGVDSETDTTDNDACTNLPDPSVDLVKVAESSTYNGDDTYTVVYTVTANNLADGPGFYDLTDTILPGNGITVMQAQLVSYNPGTEDSQTGTLAGALPHTFTSGDQLVTNEALAGGRNESWTIEVDFAVDLDSADDTFQCSDANGGAGTGFYNEIEGSPSDPDETNNRACSEPGGRSAGFTVTKDFSDDNTAKVQVTISCNDGFLSANSFLISEFSGGVRFVATSFIPGSMDCEITEQLEPDGYTGSYEAEAGASGAADSIEGGLTGCSFTGVVGGEFTCAVTNTLDEVDVIVYKEWLTNSAELDGSISTEASAIYRCYNVLDAPDGSSGDQTGDLFFIGDDEESIPVYPSWAGDSWCEVDEVNVASAAEFDDSDCQNVPVLPGVGGSCTIYNTVFFEGIPVLSRNGLMIMVLLMLGLGAVGIRRFV